MQNVSGTNSILISIMPLNVFQDQDLDVQFRFRFEL